MNKLTRSVAAVLFASATLLSCDDENNVIGLNDATKYGFIKVTLEGTRPDGEEFEVTKTFKFAPSTGPAGSSEVYTYVDGSTTYRNYYITRYLGAINESNDGEDNITELRLYATEDSEEDETTFVESWFHLETSVITSGKKYFYVSEYIDIDEDDVTNYQYNPATGKFSFKFQSELGESSTGYPLRVTVQVNATVFEGLYNEL